jgi:Spy/CpxP family protein refolding chaperone
MKTPRKLFVCLVLSLVVLGWPAAAQAQGFKWWQNERFKKDLALTEDQIQRLEGIYQATEPALKAQKETLDKSEEKLSRLLSDAKSDEALVTKVVDRVETARSELSKTRTLMLFKMRRILSDEQHVKLKALHEQWDKDRRARGPSGRPGSR